jgi:hypothetical protein
MTGPPIMNPNIENSKSFYEEILYSVPKCRIYLTLSLKW